MFRKIFDRKLLKFMMVGVLNTIVGWGIMFTLYNAAHMSYGFSTAANYILTSIMSFFLNKYFTFKKEGHLLSSAVKFAVNIACCYLLAFGIAKPLTQAALSLVPEGVISWAQNLLSRFIETEEAFTENIAMIVGSGFFVVFNYFGQRFFAFKNEE
ncbi:MAG: GtrA family protein [Clostridia bacterium]|nr:GtrA family protein [Clostridia bacterium]